MRSTSQVRPYRFCSGCGNVVVRIFLRTVSNVRAQPSATVKCLQLPLVAASRSTAAPAFRTCADTLERGRYCYAGLLCEAAFRRSLLGKRMGGDSNPWCLAAHTLSRRAQSTALSPILSNPARNRNRARSMIMSASTSSQLQPAEQFIERQLNADKKFTKIRVLRAHSIKTHFVNDFLNLESIAREKRHTPFGIVQSR
jgi:hypothetical protein